MFCYIFFLSKLWRRLNEDPDFKENEHLVSLRVSLLHLGDYASE